MHEGRGVVAKFIVQNGTLHVGDAIVCGSAFGRVKAMYDTLRRHVTYDDAPPSMPVNLTGLNEAPGGRRAFLRAARYLDRAADRRTAGRQEPRRVTLGGQSTHVTLENLFDRLGKDDVQTLNIILRADVRGSIEAIQKELTKLEHPEVKIKILQATVGGVTEADVHLADASDAIIIGFNVVPDEGARSLAEQRGVQVRRYDIIYKVTEDLRAALEGMLKPEQREMELGRALVQRTFTISRVGTIAGCRVLSGTIQRNAAGPRHSRQPRHRRVCARFAEARKGRRPRGPRRARMRHEAGRVQRSQGGRRARGLQDRGGRPDVLMPLLRRIRGLPHPSGDVPALPTPRPLVAGSDMTSRRMQKVAEAIREVVSMAILTEIKDPRVRDVTVTRVEVSGRHPPGQSACVDHGG